MLQPTLAASGSPPCGCAGEQLIDLISSPGWRGELQRVLAAVLEHHRGFLELLLQLAHKLKVRVSGAMGPAVGHYTVPPTTALCVFQHG